MEAGSILDRQAALEPSHPRKHASVRSSYSAPVSPLPSAVQPSRTITPTKPTPVARQNIRRTIRTPRTMLNSNVAAASTPTTGRAFDPDASIVLVGIRGCGKRSLGFIAAAALGRRFITEDHYFQSATGLSRQDYLKIHGSQEFHKRDVEVSRSMLDENKTKCVIECGLGSLTVSVQEYLKSYARTNPVIYLIRDMAEIKKLLQLGDRSARLLENGDPTHRRCSNYEFYNLEDYTTMVLSDEGSPDRKSPTYPFKLKDVREDFAYFVRQITGAASSHLTYDSPFSLTEMPVDLRLYTHALEVNFSDYEDGRIEMSELESGGDVVEICVDRWKPTSTSTLSKMVAEVRRKIGVPILLSASYDSAGVEKPTYVRILEHGLRLGVEFLAVDLDLNHSEVAKIVGSKGYTRIIGHTLDRSSNAVTWDDDVWVSRFDRAEMLGCDLVRFLRLASSREDNDALRRFSEKVRSRTSTCLPLIAYNVGALGRTSQVFNPILTRVTHPALQRNSSPRTDGLAPHISSREAIQALFQSFVLDPLRFYILGASVSYSLSPAIHNAAYKILGFNHVYQTKDITTFSEIEAIAQDPQFGGASIVQPWKVAIFSRLASKSRHAEAIGAVNTLIPLRAQADGTVYSLQTQASQRNRAGRVVAWYGDNTDWIGITVCLTRNLSPVNVVKPFKSTGLVVGAGGMARAAVYAMIQIGCRNVFMFNRTRSNAEAVAQHFNTWAAAGNENQEKGVFVRVLPSIEDPWPSEFAMPTMIVSTVPRQGTNGKPASDFTVPTQWLNSSTGGVIVEMAYKPAETPLVKQVRNLRNQTKTPWVLVDGLEILPEQAIAQFELMTGRKAPRGEMRAEVLKSHIETST